MIEICEGDLFRAPIGIICHQVNCQGVMGCGIAKTFKEKYPYTFELYASFCREYDPIELLGKVMLLAEQDGKYSCCMFAQNDWRGHGCNTNYVAFRECCKAIKQKIERRQLGNIIINMPYRIGAGLGGGDWEIIYSILEEEFDGYNVVLWKLN